MKRDTAVIVLLILGVLLLLFAVTALDDDGNICNNDSARYNKVCGFHQQK